MMAGELFFSLRSPLAWHLRYKELMQAYFSGVHFSLVVIVWRNLCSLIALMENFFAMLWYFLCLADCSRWATKSVWLLVCIAVNMCSHAHPISVVQCTESIGSPSWGIANYPKAFPPLEIYWLQCKLWVITCRWCRNAIWYRAGHYVYMCCSSRESSVGQCECHVCTCMCVSVYVCLFVREHSLCGGIKNRVVTNASIVVCTSTSDGLWPVAGRLLLWAGVSCPLLGMVGCPC